MSANLSRATSTRLKKAWAEWLGGLPFDHYATLTFARNSGPDFAQRAFRRYVRSLERVAQLPVFWFLGLEDGRLLGRLHLHSLLGNTSGLTIEYLCRCWTSGHSRILEYRAELGAAYYVAKYVTKDLTEYDVSANISRAIAIRCRQTSLTLNPKPGGEGD